MEGRDKRTSSVAALPLAHDVFAGLIAAGYRPFTCALLVVTTPAAATSCSRFLFLVAGGAVIADDVLAVNT